MISDFHGFFCLFVCWVFLFVCAVKTACSVYSGCKTCKEINSIRQELKKCLVGKGQFLQKKEGGEREKTYLDILYKQVHLLNGVLYLTVSAFKINKD